MAALSQTSLAASPNLRAYYSLNDVLTSSVNGYTLTNNGSAPFVAGKFGNAIDLGASNTTDYLSTTSDLGINGGAMAFSLWIKMDSEITSGVDTFIVQQNNSSDVAYSIFYDYNGGTRRVTFRRTRQNASVDEFSYNITLGTANFVHLVLNYDGSNVQGYINNVLRGSVASSGNGASGANPTGFNLGRNISAANYASAIIDDVGVFDRALTTAEISELYTSSGGGAFFMLFD